MTGVSVRPVQEADLGALAAARSQDVSGLNWFGFVPANALHRRFAADGMISDDSGVLVVETPDGKPAGLVSWSVVRHGPSSACRALNIGISLFPEHRSRGYGSAAQRALAEYLFATTLVERLEAGTDVDNVAEQRALEKAASPVKEFSGTPSSAPDSGGTSCSTACSALKYDKRSRLP